MTWKYQNVCLYFILIWLCFNFNDYVVQLHIHLIVYPLTFCSKQKCLKQFAKLSNSFVMKQIKFHATVLNFCMVLRYFHHAPMSYPFLSHLARNIDGSNRHTLVEYHGVQVIWWKSDVIILAWNHLCFHGNWAVWILPIVRIKPMFRSVCCECHLC